MPHGSLMHWPRNTALGDEIIKCEHRLAETGLFSDEKLLELFDAHEPDELLVYRMGDDHRNLDDFRLGERGRLSAEELLKAVYGGHLWLNIIKLTVYHEHYRNLIDEIYDELESKAPGFKTVFRSANLLVSSPDAQVFYHADAPLNMLWHLRGEKRVWVYPNEEKFAPREWVEMIFTRESDDDLPYDPSFDAYASSYDLKPGEMLTWPQNTPHRVENISGLNVSMTTEHYTPQAIKKRMTYLSNHYLRKWLRLPTYGVEVDGARASLKRTAFRIARRIPGFRETVEVDDTAKFVLDK